MLVLNVGTVVMTAIGVEAESTNCLLTPSFCTENTPIKKTGIQTNYFESLPFIIALLCIQLIPTINKHLCDTRKGVCLN